MAKGGAYEREVAKVLSLWWSGKKEEDDVFWRSQSSGGRATTRAKRGLTTSGHYGDICSVDQRGKPFTDLVTVEIKRGYNLVTLSDLLDFNYRGPVPKKPRAQDFIAQAKAAAAKAGTPYWMVVHRRDKRFPLLWVPAKFLTLTDTYDEVRPQVRLFEGSKSLAVCSFYSWLETVPSSAVKELAKRTKR